MIKNCDTCALHRCPVTTSCTRNGGCFWVPGQLEDGDLRMLYTMFTLLMLTGLVNGEAVGKKNWDTFPKRALVEFIKQVVARWEDVPSPQELADVANWLMFLTRGKL